MKEERFKDDAKGFEHFQEWTCHLQKWGRRVHGLSDLTSSIRKKVWRFKKEKI